MCCPYHGINYEATMVEKHESIHHIIMAQATQEIFKADTSKCGRLSSLSSL